MIKKENFEKKENVFSAKYEIIRKKVSLYIYQDITVNEEVDESKEFKIFGYTPRFPVVFIRSVANLKEVNKYIVTFCKDLALLDEVADNYDLTKFLKKQSERRPNKRRSAYRLATTCQDGTVVEMYVRWEQKLFDNTGGYIPIVKDVEIKSGEIKEGQLHPSLKDEEDAKLIVDSQMNKLNCDGYYDRESNRKLRNQFKHERRSIMSHEINEYYIMGNGERTELSKIQYNSIMNIISRRD